MIDPDLGLDDILAPPAWMRDALCPEHPEIQFFPERGQSTREAKRICGRCLVQRECRDYAVENGLEGVWGGLSEKERKKLVAIRNSEAA